MKKLLIKIFLLYKKGMLAFLCALPFSFTKTFFMSYQPDAFRRFGKYKHIDVLRTRFAKKNLINNGLDNVRLWGFVLNLEHLFEDRIPGHIAELGVWRGNTSSILAHYAKLHERKLFLFDTFEGFSRQDMIGIDSKVQMEFSDTSIALIRGSDWFDSSFINIIPGHFPDSVSQIAENLEFAVVVLDADLYEPIKKGLEYFFPRLSTGGMIFVHDYSSQHWPGVKKAIDEFRHENSFQVILLPDKSGSCLITK